MGCHTTPVIDAGEDDGTADEDVEDIGEELQDLSQDFVWFIAAAASGSGGTGAGKCAGAGVSSARGGQ